VRQYRGRISGPLLDRIDLHIEVPRVSLDAIAGDKDGESTASVRARVIAAREIQRRRFAGVNGLHCNAQMGLRLLKEYAMPDARGGALLRMAAERLGLSGAPTIGSCASRGPSRTSMARPPSAKNMSRRPSAIGCWIAPGRILIEGLQMSRGLGPLDPDDAHFRAIVGMWRSTWAESPTWCTCPDHPSFTWTSCMCVPPEDVRGTRW